MINNYIQTLKTLFKVPRNVIDAFVYEGDKPFMHPFKFLIIGALFVTLLNSVVVDFSFTVDTTELDTITDSEQAIQIAEAIQVSNVLTATQFLPFTVMLLLVPMLTIGGLIFLRENTDGFYNNLILNSYAVGGTILFLILLTPFWIISNIPLTATIANTSLPGVISAGVIIWIYSLYLRPNGVMGWIRLISAYATGYLLYIILSGFVSGVIGYMVFVINRIIELSAS